MIIFRFRSGDCTKFLSTLADTCNDKPSCRYFLTANNVLSDCGNVKADYVQVEYYCIPNPRESYDVCQTPSLNPQESGTIKSPGYPKYQATKDRICVTKMTAPIGKTFNIFTVDSNINKRDSTQK